MGKPILCIGGPLDGEFVTALHGARMSVPILEERSSEDAPVELTDATSPYERAEYRKEDITTELCRLHLWVSADLENHEAVERLIEGYRPSGEKAG